MAEEHITTEAQRQWDLDWEKMRKKLPPVTRVSRPAPPTGVVNKQQPEVVRGSMPVKKAVTPTVLQQSVSHHQEKPTVAPVQQTEGNSHQPKKGSFMTVKDPVVRMLIIVIVGFVSLTGIDVIRDWSAERRNRLEIADAKAEKDSAEIKASTPSLEKKTPVTPVTVSSGPVYNCNSVESVQAGFRQRKVHSLSEVSGTPITGCMLLSIGTTSDGPVAFSGSNYVIELPVDPSSASYDDKSSYFRCPTTENPSCSEMFGNARKLPIYQNKAVRVLTMVDGNVTITQTN